MKIKKIGLGAVIALMTTLGQASATVVLSSDVTGGWSQGSGTSNGAFTRDQETGGIELGLRASIRGGGGGPVTPAAGTDIYDVPGGTKGGLALWNYDFSINPGNLTNFTANLTITGDGQSSSLNPLLIGDNTTNTAGAKQNSENMAFGLFGGFNFNPNADVTYTFDLTLMNATGQIVASDEIQVAVPEPSTWAMMMIGFLGVGLMVYRRRETLHFA
jgi:hypothetical protein